MARRSFFPYLPQEIVLMVPDRNILIFCSIGDNFNQTSHFGLGIQGHAEEF